MVSRGLSITAFILSRMMQAGLAGLLQRFLHDGMGDVGHLDVHLQGGDAVLGAGDLEVHVAVVILGAGDVGQDGVLLAFHHQAHGDARDRSGNRHAGVHQRQSVAPHTEAMELEPFDSRMSLTTRMV